MAELIKETFSKAFEAALVAAVKGEDCIQLFTAAKGVLGRIDVQHIFASDLSIKEFENHQATRTRHLIAATPATAIFSGTPPDQQEFTAEAKYSPVFEWLLTLTDPARMPELTESCGNAVIQFKVRCADACKRACCAMITKGIGEDVAVWFVADKLAKGIGDASVVKEMGPVPQARALAYVSGDFEKQAGEIVKYRVAEIASQSGDVSINIRADAAECGRNLTISLSLALLTPYLCLATKCIASLKQDVATALLQGQPAKKLASIQRALHYRRSCHQQLDSLLDRIATLPFTSTAESQKTTDFVKQTKLEVQTFVKDSVSGVLTTCFQALTAACKSVLEDADWEIISKELDSATPVSSLGVNFSIAAGKFLGDGNKSTKLYRKAWKAWEASRPIVPLVTKDFIYIIFIVGGVPEI